MPTVFRKNRSLVVKLHGGLGDQLSMFFSAAELARSTCRKLVLAKWSIDHTHSGSPYGLFTLINQNIPVEMVQQTSTKIAQDIHLLISGVLRSKFSEKTFFRLKLPLDQLFGIINNVSSFNFDVAGPEFIERELKTLQWRRRIQFDCYFSSFSNFEKSDLRGMLPGLVVNFPDAITIGQAVAHFRVGDIFDQFTARGVLNAEYYNFCIQSILKITPGITVYGVSDNVERAKTLYPNVPVTWIQDSDKYDALEVLGLLTNSRFLIAANSGLSYWAGRLGVSTEKVYVPLFPTKVDLASNSVLEPLDQNWVLIRNDFIS